MSHLEWLWEDPAYRSFVETLARNHMFVRYDSRGNGMSDWRVPSIGLDELVADLEAIMDELQLTDITLHGTTFGGPIAVAYAVRHYERVSSLILDGSYARGCDLAGPERRASIIETLRTLPEAGMLLIGHLTNPERNPPHKPERYLRIVSPEAASQLYGLGFAYDVTALLPQVRLPTLVLHRRSSRSIPFKLGRELASSIPGARFVPLEGAEHNLWEGNSAEALSAIGTFLGEEYEQPGVPTPKTSVAPLTVLFTDMEGSTLLTHRLGDVAAREIMHEHNAILREPLGQFGGSLIADTGDGIMATFASASAAVEYAVAVQRAFASRNDVHPETPIRVRVGINAGEPVAEGDNLFGAAVQAAARIADRAHPGQVLVSEVVRQLATGKGFTFIERGRVKLKGFPERFRLYEVGGPGGG